MITNYKNFLLLEKNLTVELLSRKDENWWDNFVKNLTMNKSFYLDQFNKVKIKNYDEIIGNIIDLSTGKVDKDKAYAYFTSTGKKGGRYEDVIELENGEFVGLNDLLRTWDFGSNPGSSLGTIQTRINETIQAIVFAIRYKKGAPITEEDIKEFIADYNNPEAKYVDKTLLKVGLNVKIGKKNLTAISDEWMYTYMTIANELFDKYLDDINSYFFYQAFFDDENSTPKILRNQFHKILKKMNLGFEIDFAKWNPADIFIVNEDKEREIKERILLCEDMEELNIVIDYYFDKNYLVGMSLKKISPDRKLHLIVNKEEKSDFKYIKSTTSKESTASMSVNIHVEAESTIPTAKNQVMTARIYTGDKESNIILEIKGRDAKYGKASMSYLNKVLKDVGVDPIPTFDSEEISEMNDTDLINAIEGYYKVMGEELGTTDTKTDRYNIKESRSKLISKYQGLLLANILELNKNKPAKDGIIGKFLFMFGKKDKKSDYIVKHLFYYAYAMGNEIFQNCKYYRIGNSSR